MKKRLTHDNWQAIRSIWEYSPDEPGYLEAAKQAAEKHGFKLPSKQAIQQRAKSEGWQRKGSLTGANKVAHRIADKCTKSDGTLETEGSTNQVDGNTAKRELAEFEESAFKRAEVRIRHRQEWHQVAELRKEALALRDADSGEAFHRLKIAKITAEVTKIQQEGESKAWGLDDDAATQAAQAAAAASAASAVTLDAFRHAVQELRDKY